MHLRSRAVATLVLILALPAAARAGYTIPGKTPLPVSQYELEVDAGAEGLGLTGYCPGPFLPAEASYCQSMPVPTVATDSLPVGGVPLRITAPAPLSALTVTDGTRPLKVSLPLTASRARTEPLTVTRARTLTLIATYAIGYRRTSLLEVLPLGRAIARAAKRGRTRLAIASNVDGKAGVGRTCAAATAQPRPRQLAVQAGETTRVTLKFRSRNLCVVLRADDRKRVQRLGAPLRR